MAGILLVSAFTFAHSDLVEAAGSADISEITAPGIFLGAQPVMDLLIDGDGDNIYGAIGTGLGGFSQQNAVAGDTIFFTVTLEHLGGGLPFEISWNTPAGWEVLLDGMTSPASNVNPGVFTLEVRIPSTADGTYDLIIDGFKMVGPYSEDSVNGRVVVTPPPPPVVDLVIDGDGAGVTALAGSGGGGSAILFGDPGTLVTSVLQVFNTGGVADSFQISWQEPPGWPAGSVYLSDGVSNFTSTFVTSLIAPDSSLTYTVYVQIPAGADISSDIIIDAVSLLFDTEDSVFLEVITAAFVTGFVFDDIDHDGTLDPGESGWSGVTVTLSDPVTPYTEITGAAGEYMFTVPSGISRDAIEITPGGMVSLSPDTVSTGVMSAGDTVYIDFADVMVSTISPEQIVIGTVGAFVELPHTITAGTEGQATVNVALPAGWTAVWYRDVNGDGTLDPLDTLLTAADLYLDPQVAGQDVVPVIIRVFIPLDAVVGSVVSAVVTLQQTLSGTSIVTAALITDSITVLDSSSGYLVLVKSVDLSEARPGDIITYTIDFSNPGTEGIMDIEVVDAISPLVELILDAYGPGNDIEWTIGGAPVYLTADPGDADEGLYDAGSGTLRVIFSRQAPVTLEAGESGSVVYQARVR